MSSDEKIEVLSERNVCLRKKRPGVWEVGFFCGVLGYWQWSEVSARAEKQAKPRAVPILAQMIEASARRFRERADSALERMQELTSEAFLLRKMPNRAPFLKLDA